MYGLKHSGRIWYQRYKDEMIALGFYNKEIAPCLFIKREKEEFRIIAIYIDDINLFAGYTIMINQTIKMLKKTFKMKDFGQINFCLGLQFEYLQDGILLHQNTYKKKVFKQFNMDKAHPITFPMKIRSFDREKDIFRKRSENEP
jgi:hypothetical protein